MSDFDYEQNFCSTPMYVEALKLRQFSLYEGQILHSFTE